MNIFKKFMTDPQKENEGSWIEIGDGARLLIARAGNENYKAYYRKISAPHKTKFRRSFDILNDPELNNLADEMMIDAMANTILLGWEGIKDQNNADIPFSIQNARKLLEIKDFRFYVYDLAGDIENFKAVEQEESEKN